MTSDDIEIRVLEESASLPLVIDLLAAHFVEHSREVSHFALRNDWQEGYEKALSRSLDHPDHCTLLALIDDAAVGVLMGWYREKEELRKGSVASISELYVKPSERRRGVGASLVRYFIDDWAAERDASRIVLQTQMGSEAQAFWEAMAFVPQYTVMERNL